MREAIFIGPRDWVSRERTRWAERIDAFARDLRLSGSRLPAADPFFAAVGRGRHLIQQLKGLKEELRMAVGADSVRLWRHSTCTKAFSVVDSTSRCSKESPPTPAVPPSDSNDGRSRSPAWIRRGRRPRRRLRSRLLVDRINWESAAYNVLRPRFLRPRHRSGR